ncbi:hypothetical protein WJX81_003824 [Elliptochloris bilobata]|uniref:SHSP domain-containing protein n=1 Tax=Elliptochloris bilobata TaxID=381761 RepID=A0AAW1RMA7_9CHLO
MMTRSSAVASTSRPSAPQCRAPAQGLPLSMWLPQRPNLRMARTAACRPGMSGSSAYGPFVWNWNTSGMAARQWAQIMRDLADGKVPSGVENGDAFSETAAAMALPMDVDETQDAFIYTADVPGLEKGDLKIRVNQQDRQLTISGERRRKPANGNADAERDEDAEPAARQQRSERRFGKFRRQLKLPETADPDAVSARVDKGVLMLTVSKRAEAARPVYKDIFVD